MGIFGSFMSGDLDSDLEVSAEEARTLVDKGATVLDVREAHEWEKGHDSQAVHIPLGQIADNDLAALGEAKKVVVYCAHGVRSLKAARALKERGFDAVSVRGGFETWKEQCN
ncbi:rhodanese-like domain-containing protein [Actinomycetaceae bacterium TAE3-ERU4]|nr:rhodanese-like domain-containing protein [Actinomycetaceae bacterium TAE3-ERU4]